MEKTPHERQASQHKTEYRPHEKEIDVAGIFGEFLRVLSLIERTSDL
jgi:hypothetical protein